MPLDSALLTVKVIIAALVSGVDQRQHLPEVYHAELCVSSRGALGGVREGKDGSVKLRRQLCRTTTNAALGATPSRYTGFDSQHTDNSETKGALARDKECGRGYPVKSHRNGADYGKVG
jgi:hypothetical protein